MINIFFALYRFQNNNSFIIVYYTLSMVGCRKIFRILSSQKPVTYGIRQPQAVHETAVHTTDGQTECPLKKIFKRHKDQHKAASDVASDAAKQGQLFMQVEQQLELKTT